MKPLPRSLFVDGVLEELTIANDKLKTALSRAGLTSEQFAEIVGVDPKTVERWIAGRTPYTRHRLAIARALDSAEAELWPNITRPPAATSASGGPLPPAGDVIGSWAYSDDEAGPDPVALIRQSSAPVFIYDDGWYSILENPGLIDALLEATHAGREIRLLAVRPAREMRTLVGQAHVGLRCTNYDMWATAIRVADTILFTLRLTWAAVDPPPLLHLHRATNDGLFDRLAEHLDYLWDASDEVVHTVEELHEWLQSHAVDPTHHYEYAGENADLEPPDPAAADPSRGSHPASADQPTPSPSPDSQATGSEPPRRWPRTRP